MSDESVSPVKRRLLALSRYIGALEQGEIDPVIEILSQAEHDPQLAQMLQEVHALYQEDEQVVVSELAVRRAMQTTLPPQSSRTLHLHDQRVPLRSELQEIRIQRGNKEIIMDEQISVRPLEERSEFPQPPRRRARQRWLSLVAALLAICVLIAGMPVLLHLRGQIGSSGVQIEPTPGATATPQSGPSQYQVQAARYVSQMSLDDEIGQLLMIEYAQKGYSSDLDYMINTLHVGGVIMYSSQLNSINQVKGDVAHMQQRAQTPMFISIDEEGCPYIERLKAIYGCHMNATQMRASGDPNIAKQQGQKLAQQLVQLGINVNLAPDVDIEPLNGDYLLGRTFGSTPQQVITYAGAYMQGLQGNGVIACIKSFPGLGGATVSANEVVPVVNSSKQQIDNSNLLPFKAFIQSSNALLHPSIIMSTNVLMPAIDPVYPAEFSHTFITDILRNELHYNGVVLTDALYVGGISGKWNLNQAAVLALQAGNDMLVGAGGFQQANSMIQAIKQAVQNGQLSKARIVASVIRIIALKMHYHLMSATA